MAAQRHALFQLTQRRLVETVGQLGLPGEDDGQQLLGGGLDVREQPDFLEQLVRQALRLVDDERDDLALRAPLAQHALELVRASSSSRSSASAPRSKPRARNSMNSLRLSAGIVQVQDPRAAAGIRLERRADERRLARARLAEQQRDALAGRESRTADSPAPRGGAASVSRYLGFGLRSNGSSLSP